MDYHFYVFRLSNWKYGGQRTFAGVVLCATTVVIGGIRYEHHMSWYVLYELKDFGKMLQSS